jgi:hypothetical protein
MKDKEKYENAKQLVQEFQTLFKSMFNTTPLVLYELDDLKLPSIVLNELEIIVNNVYKREFPDIPNVEGIRSKKRLFTIIMFRYIFYKIAREMGYPLMVIGKYLGFDHATVLHGTRCINNLLETNEPRYIKFYNHVRNEVQNRVIDNANVHAVEQSGDNT